MFASKDTVWVASNKTARFWWDRANDALKAYVSNTLVMTLTSSAITFAKSLTLSAAATLTLNEPLAVDSGTATASSSAATVSNPIGKVTSEGLTTAAQASETLTITNTDVAATSHVYCSLANGTNTQGVPCLGVVTPGAGSFTVEVENQHASEAFNGTVVVSFMVVNPAA